MEEMIMYVRKRKTTDAKTGKKVLNGEPKGVIVAVAEGNRVGIGYALCSNNDTFTKEKGKQIAKKRASALFSKDPFTKSEPMPQTIQKHMASFVERAKAYFADKEFPSWTNQLEGTTSAE